MGVINITQRSERLGNLGGTSAAHGVTNTDIGQVRHTVARTFSPHYYNRNSHAGDGAIADGLGKIGDTLVRIGAAVVQREEDRKVDDYANAMLDSMEKQGRDDRDIDDWNTPDRKHLQGQKRGFYLRTGEGTKTVVDEWDRAFADTFRKIGDSIDANDRVRERTMDKLANYRRATVSRLADNQAAEYRRMEMDSAKGNLSSQIALWKNGRTEVLPDIFAQQERVDNLSLATPEKRKANREALALKLTSDFVGNSLDQCQTPEDFDKVEKAVRGGLKDAIPDMIARNLPGGERTVGGENQKVILEDVQRAKRTFIAKRDAQEREARQAIGKDFTERELAMRDVPEELWADAYESLGHNERLRKADPARAMRFLDTAREMREATAKAKANAEKAAAKAMDDAAKARADAAKAEIKANEDGLAGALCQLQVLELEGSLPQDAANEAQAALWRKFRVCALGRTVSPSFMHSFMGRMQTRLSDQEANAMRKFYRAFGYSPDLNSSGEASATERNAAQKDSVEYYAPLETDGIRLESSDTRIKAADLLRYGDSLLMTLRALGPDMNREGVVDREIARIKTSWIKGEIDRNRDAMVRSVLDIQREARTRWIAEQGDTTTKESKGDGRNGDQDASK